MAGNHFEGEFVNNTIHGAYKVVRLPNGKEWAAVVPVNPSLPHLIGLRGFDTDTSANMCLGYILRREREMRQELHNQHAHMAAYTNYLEEQVIQLTKELNTLKVRSVLMGQPL